MAGSYIDENDERYKEHLQDIRSGKENESYNIIIQKFDKKGNKIKEYKTH